MISISLICFKLTDGRKSVAVTNNVINVTKGKPFDLNPPKVTTFQRV
jgi:hypothetical protein